jgi:hypothetical protein
MRGAYESTSDRIYPCRVYFRCMARAREIIAGSHIDRCRACEPRRGRPARVRAPRARAIRDRACGHRELAQSETARAGRAEPPRPAEPSPGKKAMDYIRSRQGSRWSLHLR